MQKWTKIGSEEGCARAVFKNTIIDFAQKWQFGWQHQLPPTGDPNSFFHDNCNPEPIFKKIADNARKKNEQTLINLRFRKSAPNHWALPPPSLVQDTVSLMPPCVHGTFPEHCLGFLIEFQLHWHTVSLTHSLNSVVSRTGGGWGWVRPKSGGLAEMGPNFRYKFWPKFSVYLA